MKKLVNILAAAVLMFSMNSVFAGYLATNGTIQRITNTKNNTDSFGLVVVQAGEPNYGNLCEGLTIYFPLTAAGGNQAIHNRAYSTALTAFASGAKVTIHNYTDNSCDGASYIELVK